MSRHLRYATEAALRDGDHELIALAIAYHDSIYVSGAGDNESRSAAHWLEVSASQSICSESDRLWIADTIRATADHVAAAGSLIASRANHRARQWLLDLDLTPLSEPPDVFDANMADLAAEMPSGEPSQRYEKLIKGLRHFAAARPLHRSIPLRIAFEICAQANMMRFLNPPNDPSLAR